MNLHFEVQVLPRLISIAQLQWQWFGTVTTIQCSYTIINSIHSAKRELGIPGKQKDAKRYEEKKFKHTKQFCSLSKKLTFFFLLGMTLKWKVLAFTESIFPEIFVTTSVLKNTNCSLHSTDHRLLTEELANLFWKTLTQICTSAVLALQYTAIKAQIKNRRIAKCNPRKAWSMQTGLLQKAEKWRHATNLKKKKKVAACSEFQTQSQDYLTIINGVAKLNDLYFK